MGSSRNEEKKIRKGGSQTTNWAVLEIRKKKIRKGGSQTTNWAVLTQILSGVTVR